MWMPRLVERCVAMKPDRQLLQNMMINPEGRSDWDVAWKIALQMLYCLVVRIQLQTRRFNGRIQIVETTSA